MADHNPLDELRAQREAAAASARRNAQEMQQQLNQQQAPHQPAGKSRPPARARAGFGDWHVPREWLDTFVPVGRVSGGALFVAYSSLSTIFLMAADLAGLLGDSGWMLPYRYWVSIGAALVLFVGEAITAERWPHIYWALLVPDILYTARSMAIWLPRLIESAPFLAYLFLLWGIWWLGLVHSWPKAIQYTVIAVVGLAVYAMMWGTSQEGTSAELRGFAVLVFTWTASIVNGYLVARFGELMLFGRRRALA